jgi:quercetin dioxygenase-like cupin family protein
MYVFRNVDAATAAIPGIHHQTLAGQASGLARLSIWRQVMESGAATPAHRHDCEEVVIVEAGSGELLVEGVVHAFGPGTTLVIPRNVDHQIVNTGTAAMQTLAVFSQSPVAVFQPDGAPLPLPWNS